MLAVALACFGMTVLLAGPALSQDPTSELRRMERRLFEGVNEERAKQGLSRLAWDDDLAAAAREHALNMAARRFFSHVDPILGRLRNRLLRRGIQPRAAGENLFMESGYENPVPRAVQEWMASPEHRKTILTAAFSRSGAGVAVSADGKLYFVQILSDPHRTTSSSR